MQLPKETMERLGILSDEMSLKIWNMFPLHQLPLSADYRAPVCCEIDSLIYKELTTYAERSQKLVRALENLVADIKRKPNDTRYATAIKSAEEALSQYNNPEIKKV